MFSTINLSEHPHQNSVNVNKKLVKQLGNNNYVTKFDESGKTMIEYTPIQSFYSHQTVFITGATGFLGKVLLEKLLRCCSDISRVYVLVRPKKGKDVQERVQDLMNDSVFDNVRSNVWNFEEKVVGISGDCSSINLGLSDDDMNLLKEQVSIVFHVAATVRFDEKLKLAAAINVRSTLSILKLCEEMTNLKSVVHVSTAYANCFAPEIEEKFYDYPLKAQEFLHLVDLLPENTIDAITPELLGSWPNSYTFTKALAEDIVRTEGQHLPMGIFRPGIVTAAAHEPMPGWTDNYNGPTGMIAGAASGLMRTIHIDASKITNIIPVDLTVNALIASACDVGAQTNRKGEGTLIYNFTSTVDSPISWGTFMNITKKFVLKYPTKIAIWCTTIRPTKYRSLYTIYTFLLHHIPGVLFDFVARISGRPPRLRKAYGKIHKMVDTMGHFGVNEWKFRNDNVQSMWNRLDSRDRQLFHFTMKNFNWTKYLSDYVKGIRVYLFKDGLDTLESSRAKHKRFLMIHILLIKFLQALILLTARMAYRASRTRSRKIKMCCTTTI